jgi:molybdopterin-containing oxidoreductase family membrane subunit
MDIGRPDRFWHGFVFWNPHSPLWEVTMCVGLYFTVLTLEVLPIIGEADWVKKRLPWLSFKLVGIHRLAPILAIAGLGLSMLHQSSLGATYGVLLARPIWYRPGLAVLFIVSAMAAGPSLTVFASKVASLVSSRATVNDKALDQIAHFIGWVLVAYLYFRFWDAFSMFYTYEPGRTEGLNMLTQGTLSFNFWVGEIFLGIVVPMVILLNKRLRSRLYLKLLALFLIMGGLVAYRWDTNMVGQLVVFSSLPQGLTPLYTQYKPALIEIVVGLGAIAYALFAFTIGVRYLKVVDAEGVETEEEVVPAAAVFSSAD